MANAIVIGGSRGIGKAISDGLKSIGCDVLSTSKKELDTSDLSSVKNFIENNKTTDILVLNTGGPPAKEFDSVTEDEWQKYHNQLFLGFLIIKSSNNKKLKKILPVSIMTLIFAISWLGFNLSLLVGGTILCLPFYEMFSSGCAIL